MRKRHGYVFWGIGFLAAVFFCAGCSGKKESVPAAETLAETETTPETMHSIVLETEEETEPEEPAERVEVNGKIRSYLTGEMVAAEKADRRPVAVMMSNDRQALPQYGINRAGVVYEAPVEGDMNRYMALIEDYDDLERIGSVRSCRTYYTYFAREFDAVYVHYGQSNFAVPYLKNVDHINGVDSTGSSAFYRSRDKKLRIMPIPAEQSSGRPWRNREFPMSIQKTMKGISGLHQDPGRLLRRMVKTPIRWCPDIP